MPLRKHLILTAFFCLSLLTGVHAFSESENNPFQISADLNQTMGRSLELLYNFQFDEGLETILSVQDQAEDHPMVAMGIASAHWWRLSVYILEPDEKESEPFLKAAKECIRLAKAKIKKGDKTGEAHFVLGAVMGLVGRYEATNRNYLSAYFKGRKAIKYLRKSLKINPDVKDAYMGLGIFDYYVATLPSVVRVLAFLGSTGDKQVGLDELHIAAKESLYSRMPAKLFLVDIYANQENKPDLALEILEDLKQTYPRSPFIHLLNVVSLYNNDKVEALAEVAQDFRDRVETGVYEPEAKTQSLFSAGIAEFKKKEWEKAISIFDQAIQLNATYDGFLIFCHLHKGYALDMLGLREEAKEEYKYVLSQQRRWGSHDNAKARLKKPFNLESPEIKKLRL